MTAEPLLELRDIHKRFGGMIAVNGVSLCVTAGQVSGLVGPNGSGKTTLFNIITNFLKPDSGSVIFDGEDITHLRPERIARRGLVRTFQATLNPARLTVMENMLLAPAGQVGEGILGGLCWPAAVRRAETENIKRAREILARVKLDHQIDTYAGDLSGGQKKLLMLGQALMLKPRLVLLDEPVAGVHPNLINDIVDTVRGLSEEGQNFLVIEHNMCVIRELCDSICVLDAGEVLASGPTEETLQRDDVLNAYLGSQAVAAGDEE